MREEELETSQRERYARQIVLPEVGLAGQERLLASRVLVVGAGGLGSPVLLYLAAAGVGRLGIADGDVVELANLQRQVIHRTDALGRAKAPAAAAAVRSLNPDVAVEVFAEPVTPTNARTLVAGYDVVCDCTDTFESRTLVHDAAFAAHRPLVSASIYRLEGQLTTFRGWEPERPCYRCLFPHPPPAGLIEPCAVSGVLGAVVGVLGALQATETIKELLGIGERLAGRLLLFDGLAGELRSVWVAKDPACSLCGAGADTPTA